VKFSKEKILNSLQKVLKYYQYFDYAPTAQEAQKFLDIKITKPEFNEGLKHLLRNKKLIIKRTRVALSKKILKETIDRQNRAVALLQKFEPLLNLFSFIPTVRLLGISGSMSMNQSDKNADIDIFVITQDQYIWSTRFVVLAIKKILELFLLVPSHKLCFNLFFSNSHLTVPKLKQNLYVGHEVLQLKIVFDKDGNYQNFLQSNSWIRNFFPNVHIISDMHSASFSMSKKGKEVNILESFAKKVQVWWLKRTGYRYKENLGQLWLFQEDWEKKILSAEVAGFATVIRRGVPSNDGTNP